MKTFCEVLLVNGQKLKIECGHYKYDYHSSCGFSQGKIDFYVENPDTTKISSSHNHVAMMPICNILCVIFKSEAVFENKL